MKPAVTLLARRLANQQAKGYAGFVQKVSSIGVGVGCTALILLLSVMNGFEAELRNNLLSKLPHAEFIHINNQGIAASGIFTSFVKQDTRITAVLPVNKSFGLVQKKTKIKSTQIIGASREYYEYKFKDAFDWQLIENQTSIVLSQSLLDDLDIQLGEKIQLLIPQNPKNLEFSVPKSQWFTVIGGLEFTADLNNAMAIVNASVLNEILSIPEGRTSYLEFVLQDPFNANVLVREIGQQFDQPVYISSWYRTHGHLFYDIQLVRTVIYLVLILLICIACFNVISSLVISVKEQSKSIAILKTMGATDRLISNVFILKGIKSTLFGAIWGCIFGVLLSLYLTELIALIEAFTGIQVFDAGIYFTESLPSKLVWWNVALAFLTSLLVGWLATLYPAKKAAKLPPVQHLH